MSDNRKYYYLKLKENYFDDDSIVLLESMQDGVLYSNILLKLYLKSLKHGGWLQLDEDIPYTAQMIATITPSRLALWRGESLADLFEAGSCGGAGQRHILHEQHRTFNRPVFYRGCEAPKQGSFCAPDKWRTFSDIRLPEIELEKEIEKVRPKTGHPSHTCARRRTFRLRAMGALSQVKVLNMPR